MTWTTRARVFAVCGGIGLLAPACSTEAPEGPDPRATAPAAPAAADPVAMAPRSSPTAPPAGPTFDGLPDDLARAVREAYRPIPRDPERQRRRDRDKLEWNRRTLGGAYEQVGSRDPRWDDQAREALEAVARFFSREGTSPEEVFALADRALAAGCDDPMIRYVRARTSTLANFPGGKEYARRHREAAEALEGSGYPAFRRGTALYMAANFRAGAEDAMPGEHDELLGMFDASLDLMAESVSGDEQGPWLEEAWSAWVQAAYGGYKNLLGGARAARDRIEGRLADLPELRPARLQVQSLALLDAAWEVRGTDLAYTVTPEGWQAVFEGTTEARRLLEEAWEIRPGDSETAMMLVGVNRMSDGDREDMEMWFERAMEADGDNRGACLNKMEWLEPKWHGRPEDLLAFGRACRETGNVRARITLLAADAHRRFAMLLDETEARRYLRSDAVFGEIAAVYEEYLDRFPTDNAERTNFAVYCATGGRLDRAEQEFRALGDQYVATRECDAEFIEQIRGFLAERARRLAGPGGDLP